MKNNSGKIAFGLIFLFILLMSLSSGCIGGSAASNPILVKLSFSEPPILGREVLVTATFKLANDGVTAKRSVRNCIEQEIVIV